MKSCVSLLSQLHSSPGTHLAALILTPSTTNKAELTSLVDIHFMGMSLCPADAYYSGSVKPYHLILKFPNVK